MSNLTSARGKEEKQRLDLLWERWLSTRESASPDYAARDLLYDHYGGYVIRSTNAVAPVIPRHLDREDLLSAGAIALVHALNRFDPARGVQFPSYAITLVRGAVMEYLRSDDWLPRSVRYKETQVAKAEARLLSRIEPVTEATLARELGVTEEVFRENYRPPPALISLDEEIKSLAKGPAWSALFEWEKLKEDPEQEPERVFEREEEASLLKACVSYLETRERAVIERYHYQGMTLLKVAQSLNLSESRLHQIYYAALNRLEGFLGTDSKTVAAY